MKLIKPFYGVPDGAFYPVHYQKGDDCPPELEEAAREAGCLKDGKKAKSDRPPAASDNADAANSHVNDQQEAEQTEDNGESAADGADKPADNGGENESTGA